MGAFRDILIDGSAKRRFFKQVDDIWKGMEKELIEYKEEQDELNQLAQDSMLRYKKSAAKMKSKSITEKCTAYQT